MQSTIGKFFCRAIHPLFSGLTVTDEFVRVPHSLSEHHRRWIPRADICGGSASCNHGRWFGL